MATARKTKLGPNDQETLSFNVAENTDSVLITLKSNEHDDIITIPTWVITDEDSDIHEQFPEAQKDIDAYPAKLEPLGDTLQLKVRNATERETSVTVGFRQKKLTTV